GNCATGTRIVPVSIYGQTATGRANGGGAGLGLRASAMYLSLPQPGRRSSWWALRAGGGVDLNLLHVAIPTGVPPVVGELCSQLQNETRDVHYDSSTVLFAQVPLTLGAHVGFGHFRDGSVWHGVVLGAAWTPSLAYVGASVDGDRGSVRFFGAEAT